MHPTATDNVDAGEVAKFEALAAHWWDRDGDSKPLHDINPLAWTLLTRGRGWPASACWTWAAAAVF